MIIDYTKRDNRSNYIITFHCSDQGFDLLAKSMKEKSTKDYNEMAIKCGSNADSASRKLLEELVLDEERHFSQFDTELDNFKKFGEQYLALQSIERSKILSTQTGENPTNL